MADLTRTETTGPSAACCPPEAQASCCEPSEKAACCGTSAAGGSCGCSAGKAPDADELREMVRARYAAAAVAAAQGGGCCSAVSTTDASGNEVGDKPQVLREAARVLRPGGRFAVSDVIADEDMDEATRADVAQWTGCIAGALTEREFRDALAAAGLGDIEIRQTHRVHEHAASAIIRARKGADGRLLLDA